MSSPTPPGATPARRLGPRQIRTLIIVAAAAVVVALLLKGLLTPAATTSPTAGATPGPAAPIVGHYAPNITVRDLSNNDVTLTSLRGKVVALNFWYVACEPCKYEMPALEKSYQQYRGQGFITLGVDVTDDPATMDTFIHELGVTYPVARDIDLRAATIYRITDTPSTFFIDRQGVVRYKVVGPLDTATLTTDVTTLLAPAKANGAK